MTTSETIEKIVNTPGNGTSSQAAEPVIEKLPEERNLILISVTNTGFGNTRKVDIKALNPDASDEMITATKKLLDADEIRAMNLAQAKAVDAVRKLGVPATSILKKGTYAVDPRRVKDAWEIVTTCENETLPPLKEYFREAYPRLKEEAKEKLGEFFDEYQYPSAEEICSKYHINAKIFTMALPDPRVMKTQITDSFFAEARDQAQSDMASFLDEVKAALRGEMLEFVKSIEDIMTPRPDGGRKKIYDTTIDKLLQFISDFSCRNFANDSSLQDVVKLCDEALAGKSIGRLKSSKYARESLKEGMEKARKQLETLVDNAPTRNVVID